MDIRPDIEPAAAVGFEREAAAYAAARPPYPAQVLALLEEAAAVPRGARVCDLGAGTGIFTRQLVDAGYRVVAVEPVAAMRDELVASVPEATCVDGTAEHLPLDDSSVDVVAVAQAFHWFDPQPALREIARVLRPDGVLLMVWNNRDEADSSRGRSQTDWIRRWSEILDEFGGGRPYADHRDHLWADLVAESGRFGPLDEAVVPNAQTMTPDILVARTRSTSFIAALPAERRDACLAEVRSMCASHPELAGRDTFEMPYMTRAYWCRKLP